MSARRRRGTGGRSAPRGSCHQVVQGLHDLLAWHSIGNECVADLTHQHESDAARRGFSYPCASLPSRAPDQDHLESVWAARWHREIASTCSCSEGEQCPQARRQVGRRYQSHGHSLAVFDAVTAGQLDGVGKGVPQVQYGTPPLFERIFLDDLDFDLDGLGHQILQLGQGGLVTTRTPNASCHLRSAETTFRRRSVRA